MAAANPKNESPVSSLMPGGAMKDFSLETDPEKKKSPEVGRSMAVYIEKTLSGQTSYYWLRNQRFGINRRWANGRIDVRSMFADRMDFNGKINYVNLSWKALKLVNTVITKMVAKWMGRNEKIVATATDPISIKSKKKDYQEAEFILQNREALEHLQEQSGVPMIPQDQYVPESKDDLELWAAHLHKLPEEMLFEEGTNDILQAAGFFDTVKGKLLHGAAETGLVGTYVWMDDNGVIHPEWIKEENIIYGYSEYDDMRDAPWKGRVKSLKITELRRKYGVQFGGKLTEQQIFEIAQTSKEYQMGDKIMWIYEWTVAWLRPYDEWNVDIVEVEIKTLDIEPTTIVTTKQNKSTLIKKGKPEKFADNEEYVEDKYWQIYRLVYVRYATTVLEWGRKENMITSPDPKKLGNVDFSYSFYMYQNFEMRNVAIPERVEEPAEMIIFIRLQMQRLIAKFRPPGAAINEDAVQEIDYGLGEEGNKTIDPLKLYDQTGNIYYRGRDAEGNPIPVPIQELQNSGFLPAMQGLIQQYEFQNRVFKDELGSDPNLVSQAVKPRVAEGNVQASMQESDDSTAHIYDAYLYVTEETARKISCLLRDSVAYGAAAYRHIMKEEDTQRRAFDLRLNMLPTDREVATLEAFSTEAIRGNPDLVMYLDSFKLMRLARENVKLAEIYFRDCMKKMRESQMAQAQQNQQATFQAQSQAAQDKAAGDQQTETAKSEGTLKNTALAGLLALYTKGPLPAELQPLSQAIITNILIPVVAQNEQQKQALLAMAQQQQQQAQMQGQEQPQEQGMAMPQENQAA